MTKTRSFLFALCCLALAPHTNAQGIHYTPFYSTPTMLNPAFAGMFDGKVRAGAIYRNQWASVTVPYITIGLSADMPVVTMKDGSYIAAGIQAMKDQAGDGGLNNFNLTGSVSYHRSILGGNHPIDMGLGIQGGYSQSSINVSNLYFGTNTHFDPPPGWVLGLNNSYNAYPVALGFTLAQKASASFNYTVGLSAHNIVETGNDLSNQQRASLGFDRYYSLVAGANWLPTKRLKISPALVHMFHQSGSELIGGCEFGYRLSSDNIPQHRSTSVFLAGWYRQGEALTSMAGIEIKSIKLGVSYDYNFNSEINASSNGNGGFELLVRYIAPSLKSAKRSGSYSRF